MVLQVIGATDIISNVLHPDSEEDGDVNRVIDDIIAHFMKAGSTLTDSKPPEVEVFSFSEALASIDVSVAVKNGRLFGLCDSESFLANIAYFDHNVILLQSVIKHAACSLLGCKVE